MAPTLRLSSKGCLRGQTVKRVMIAIIAILSMAACANPSIVSVKPVEMGSQEITKIYVPRFEGNPNFVEESTDFFISTLEPNISAKIIQGSVLRTETTDVIAGGNLAPTEVALAKARESGAQLLIMGKVTSHKTGGSLNGFSTVRVVNVATGQVVGTFHRPSGMLVAFSEHQCVMAAVSRTAEDVAKMLR